MSPSHDIDSINIELSDFWIGLEDLERSWISFSHTKEGPIFSFVHNFPVAYGGLRRTIGAILKDIIEYHWTSESFEEDLPL